MNLTSPLHFAKVDTRRCPIGQYELEISAAEPRHLCSLRRHRKRRAHVNRGTEHRTKAHPDWYFKCCLLSCCWFSRRLVFMQPSMTVWNGFSQTTCSLQLQTAHQQLLMSWITSSHNISIHLHRALRQMLSQGLSACTPLTALIVLGTKRVPSDLNVAPHQRSTIE